MSAIRIRKKVAFSSVPDLVFSLKMSHTSILVLAWALGRPDGWEFYIGHMMRILNLTDKTWPRAKRELIKAGFFIQTKSRNELGKIVWSNEFTDEPLWITNSPIPPSGRDGDGMDAGGGDIAVDVSKVSKAVVVQQTATASIQGQKPTARGAPKNTSRRMNNQDDLDVLMRPFLKNELDEVRWAGLKSEFSAEQLRSAIVDVVNEGSQPLTSFISKKLKPQQKNTSAAPISSSHRPAVMPPTKKSSPEAAAVGLAAARAKLSCSRAL